MILVHHLNNSRSQRVLWLLEELSLGYDIVRYQRDPKTMLGPSTLKQVHPLGKSPVIEEDGFRLAETGAIIDYLVTTHGPHLAPRHGAPAFWHYVYWLHYAEGSAMPPLLLKLVINRLGLLGRPARGYVDGQIALHLDYLQQRLGTQPWILGEDFSAADIMLSFPLEVSAVLTDLKTSRPALASYLDRLHARPAYQRALDKGGPYDYGA